MTPKPLDLVNRYDEIPVYTPRRADMPDVAEWLGGPLAEYLSERIPKEAGHLARSYPRIPKPDYEQAMWLRAIERKDAFKRFLEGGKRWSIDRDLREAAVKLMKEDQRYTRAVRALKGGYSIEDEEFYSTGLLAYMLPALIDADFDAATAFQNATGGTDAAGVHINISDPFGGAENYQVMLIDITTAWKRLTEGQRRLLRAYYSTDQSDTQDGRWERQQLASSMGITVEALWQRAHRALRALSAQLGGESPWK